ncbi:MAG: Crp/Fnr family transcriptional regulator [Candidatus Acidiferrales bacterium]
MSDTESAHSKKTAVKPAPSGRNGHAVKNTILLGLPPKEGAAIFSKLTFVSLRSAIVLNEAGERIKFAFFVNDGLASILRVMGDGKSVEVGLCGKEGFIGLPLTAGFTSSPTRTIMQVEGSAFRVSAKDLSAALRECPTLARSLQRFSQELALQSEHVATCNRLHVIDERLVRWLLMSQDRLGGSQVPLTQTFLAYMLGTRRASVTVAAGILQKAGLISYSRGSLKIENRAGLEDAACECYETLTQQTERWRQEASKNERER